MFRSSGALRMSMGAGKGADGPYPQQLPWAGGPVTVSALYTWKQLLLKI